jgi:hypothetical protein
MFRCGSKALKQYAPAIHERIKGVGSRFPAFQLLAILFDLCQNSQNCFSRHSERSSGCIANSSLGYLSNNLFSVRCKEPDIIRGSQTYFSEQHRSSLVNIGLPLAPGHADLSITMACLLSAPETLAMVAMMVLPFIADRPNPTKKTFVLLTGRTVETAAAS